MKGYVIDTGYMGYVDGEYMLFATEGDYEEFMSENDSFIDVDEEEIISFKEV